MSLNQHCFVYAYILKYEQYVLIALALLERTFTNIHHLVFIWSINSTYLVMASWAEFLQSICEGERSVGFPSWSFCLLLQAPWNSSTCVQKQRKSQTLRFPGEACGPFWRPGWPQSSKWQGRANRKRGECLMGSEMRPGTSKWLALSSQSPLRES